MSFKEIFLGGVEEPDKNPSEKSIIEDVLFSSPRVTERIPPQKNNRANYQQDLLVPNGNELVPIEENPLNLLGQISSYLITPAVTLLNESTKTTGLAKEPGQLFSDEIKTLKSGVEASVAAQQEINSQDTSNFIKVLVEQITSQWGPARNATAMDPVESVRFPTQAERDIASRFAPELAKKIKSPKPVKTDIEKHANELNQEIVEAQLKKVFTEEELRRCATEIETLIETNNNQLELLHIPPINLLAAAILANPKLLGKAISATIFTNELKKRGISMVLRRDAVTKQSQLLILTGGPGKGVEFLPPNAQSEWNQPLPQEVASDSKWGHKWSKFWSPNLKKLFKLKFKEVYPEYPDIVEAGTLSLVNPADTTDRSDIPMLVIRRTDQRSSLGGGEALQMSARIVESAHDLVQNASDITQNRAKQASLPVELKSSLLPPPQSKDESLSRAYDEARKLLMQQGVRPEVIYALTRQYATAINKSQAQAGVAVEVGSYFKNRDQQSISDKASLIYGQLIDIIKTLENPRLSQQSKSILANKRSELVKELRQLQHQ